jgi:hypothetical protein
MEIISHLLRTTHERRLVFVATVLGISLVAFAKTVSTQIWFTKGADRNKVLEVVTTVFKAHGYELHPAPAKSELRFGENGKAVVTPPNPASVDPNELQTDYQKPVKECGPPEWRYRVMVGGDQAPIGSEVIVDVEVHVGGELMGMKTETAVSSCRPQDQQIILKEIRDKIKALGWYDKRFD